MENRHNGSNSRSCVGFDTPPQGAEGWFLAVRPTVDVARQCTRGAWHLRGKHGLVRKPRATALLHVTLRHFGVYPGSPPDPLITTVCQAAATVVMPRFVAMFDRVGSFGSSVVLLGDDGVIGLLKLQHIIDDALKKAGLGRWGKSRSTPHMTLLYDDCGIPEQFVEPAVWTVQEFVLIRSLIGQSRHIEFDRWPLRG
jgi:2'-5' RNA ligase